MSKIYYSNLFLLRQKWWTQPAAMVATAQSGAIVESGVRSPGTTKMVNNWCSTSFFPLPNIQAKSLYQVFLSPFSCLPNSSKIIEASVQFLSPHSRVVGLCGTATERRVRDVSHWGEVISSQSCFKKLCHVKSVSGTATAHKLCATAVATSVMQLPIFLCQ